MIITVDAFEKTNIHLQLKKVLSKLEIWGDFLILIKNIYKESAANLIVNSEKISAFPLRLGTKQGCWLSSVLLIILEILANAIR